MVRFRRNFLWERYGEKKKINLMRWSEVIKPKRIGILVILKIRTGLYWQKMVEIWEGNGSSLSANLRRINGVGCLNQFLDIVYCLWVCVASGMSVIPLGGLFRRGGVS